MQKSGVSIIILQKSPQEIKCFWGCLGKMNRDDEVQLYVQRFYSEECIKIVNAARCNGELFCFFPGLDQAIPASFIRSSNRKRYVVCNQFEINLRLYQIRSFDRKYYQDLLVEPFYPGSKATIWDIYCILSKKTLIKARSGSPLSYRIQYDIRKKFMFRWQSLFGNKSLPLSSFDEFMEAIHMLNPEQLFVLFGTSIMFCGNFQRSEKGD